MATHHRIFTSFAIEDANLRTMLVGQARNDRVPFEFADFSVQKPWDTSWKTNCRSRIKGCDGLIGIVTRNTPRADGQIWEIVCARDEGLPVLLVYGGEEDRGVRLPAALSGMAVRAWSWPGIKGFIERL